MDNTIFGKFNVLEDNSQQFRFSSYAGVFVIDGVNSKITMITDGKEETILLDEILRLEYGIMMYQLPPNEWKKLWIFILGGIFPVGLLGNSRDEKKWFQVSAVLRSGERIHLYSAKNLTTISDTQKDIAYHIKHAFEKHGFALELNANNRVVDEVIPQFAESLQSRKKIRIDKKDIVKWVVLNSIAVILVGFLPALITLNGSIIDSSSSDPNTLGLLILSIAGILVVGGGFIISGFQWLMMRHHLTKWQGIVWAAVGIISSATTTGTIGVFSALMLSVEGGFIVATILMLVGHLFYLYLAQSFLIPIMKLGNFKQAVIWGIVNSVVIVLAFMGSLFPISIIETNTATAILGEIIILTLAFLPSGYLITQTFSQKQR